MNERKTENIVRDFLYKNGFYNKDKFVIEEQKSDSPSINNLLKNASKSGNAGGKPEFIIRSKEHSEFIIVIECKAKTKYHESKTLDNYSKYAVDGALLYASFLSKEYDVLAIGISGEEKKDVKISHYIYPKNSKSYSKIFDNKFLTFDDYYKGFLTSEIKFNQDYNSLLSYTREINEQMHNKKIKESQRSLLISGILIALQNAAFISAYKSHTTSKQICSFLIETIINEFTNSEIPQDKIQNIKQAFSFIGTHTTLNSDKEFVEKLIEDIDRKVNQFIKTYKYYDTLGQFYIEFLRYANNDKGLGIVLTPLHITDLFVDLAGVNKNSIVFDNCCGTCGFMISAMRRMIEAAKNDSELISNIKAKQLIGIEYQDDIFALGISNMIIHNDGKTNVFLGDCYNLMPLIKSKFTPTVGMLNPPYKSNKDDIEEMEFVINNLDALKVGGKCVAIVPLSCAIALNGDVYENKKTLLEKHTLEAVMSMPEDLFHNSKVNVVTCIMVFTAHEPHPKDKKTWLGYWRNDGFEKIKSLGRIDKNNKWTDIKKNWVETYKNREVIKGYSIMQKLSADAEWCVEAYLNTDYTKITKARFKDSIQKYLAYKLLNNLLEFKKEKVAIKKQQIELVPLDEVFDVYNGVSKSSVEIRDNQISDSFVRFIRPSQTYSGSIDGYVDKTSVDNKFIFSDETIYVSTDGQGSHTYSYVSSFEFVPNSNVAVLIPKRKMSFNEKMYYAMCVTENRYKFSYGRKPKGNRLKKLKVPNFCPGFVYEDVFSEIVNNWKKIIS